MPLGITVTVGVMALLFKPRWLADIQPRNPVERYAGDPVYPQSRTTAIVIASRDGRTEASGEIDVPPSREELLAHEARVVGARRARKAAAHARQYAGRNWMAHLDAKAERRAAKEARRIMMDNRRRIRAAFAREDM